MTWSLVYLPDAEEDFRRLDGSQRMMVRKALAKLQTIPVRRLSRRMNRKYAVQEPRIWRVLLTGNPQQHAKNRRICCPRIVKIALQELQNPRSQNRRN